MSSWISILPQKEMQNLADLRLELGLEISLLEDEIWLKSPLLSQTPPAFLLQLPNKLIYRLEEAWLFPFGEKTPQLKLPKGMKWQSIKEAISIEMPTSAMPAKLASEFPIRLQEAAQTEAGAALVCSWKAWQDYVKNAFQIRLKPLRFALSEADEVLVIGNPLPAIPGKEYWLKDNMLIPAGYQLEMPRFSSYIAQRLGAGSHTYILFEPDASFQKIPKSAFQQASRRAISLQNHE